MAKRRGREFWSKIVEDFETSDARETHDEFSARRGLNKTTFEKWLYQLRSTRRVQSKRPVRLLPVHVVESAAAAHLISIDLGGGLGLRFPVGSDPAYLAALVAVLRPC